MTTARSVPYHRGGPQIAFGLAPTVVRGNAANSSLQVGSWAQSTKDGSTHPGSIGVLVDDVTAYAALSARSHDQWGVSAAITVDFHSPIPRGIVQLSCSASVDHRTTGWAHASGCVTAESGELVATVGQRFRYVPGDSSVHKRPATLANPDWMHSLDALLSPAVPRHDGTELTVLPSLGMLNPLGTIHGGISLSLSELAARRAWEASADNRGEAFHTASLHISYLGPGLIEDTPTLRVRLVHASRSVVLVEVEMHNADGTVATHALATLHRTATTL